MSNLKHEEFDCHFLDEGFTAKDILDQKINEASSSVSVCGQGGRPGGVPQWRRCI